MQDQAATAVQASTDMTVSGGRGFAHLPVRVSAVYAAIYLHYGAFSLFLPLWFANRGLVLHQGSHLSKPGLSAGTPRAYEPKR